MIEALPLAARLRNADEMLFLRWDTFEDDLLARLKAPTVSGVSEADMLLVLVKREARRRAQRDLYILILHYPEEYSVLDSTQLEEMFEIAGLNPQSLVNRTLIDALDLYRTSAAAAITADEEPVPKHGGPELAAVDGLSTDAKILLLAIEVSLTVLDRARTQELSDVGIEPDDPLFELLQSLEEQDVALYVAQTTKQDPETRERQGGCLELITEPKPEPFEELSILMTPAQWQPPSQDCNPRSPRVGSTSGPSSGEPNPRQLALLYKSLILATDQFASVSDDELCSKITNFGGNPADSFPTRLRLFLQEYRDATFET